MMNVLIIVGIIAAALGLALVRRARHGAARAEHSSVARRLWMSMPVVLLAGVLGVLLLPVVEGEGGEAKRSTIVYVGWADSEVFGGVIAWLGKRPGTIVTTSPTDVASPLPQGVEVEEPRGGVAGAGGAGGGEGFTLAVALADLKSRLEEIREEGSEVVFVVPRSEDVGRDLALRDQLVREHAWLAPRLRILTATDLGVALPSVRIDVPRSVHYGAEKVEGQVLASEVPGTGARINVARVTGDPMSPTLEPMSEGKGRLLEVGGGGELTVDRSAADWALRMGAPAPGQTDGVRAVVRGKRGEALASAWATITSEVPEVAVLAPADAKEGESSMLGLLGMLGVPHRSVELDFSSEKAATKNAGKLDRWGFLVVDTHLGTAQADVLDASLRASLKLYGRAPTLFFVGTAGRDSVPAGWARSMPDDAPRVVSRVIAVVKDASGSMRFSVASEPNRPRMPKQGELSREQCADASIEQDLMPGLKTRNAAGMIRFVVPASSAGNERQRPAEVRGKFVDVEAYTKSGSLGGLWELGPQLEALWHLVVEGKEPISDAIVFFDPTDMFGPYFEGGTGPDDSVAAKDLEKARELEKRGVRLHLISVGGSATLPEPLGACVKADFSSGDPATIRSTIQIRVFEKLFPRLTAKMAAGAENLISSADERKRLEEIAAKPELRLIAAYRAYAPEATHPDRERTALWLRHWHTDDVSPLLMKCGRDLGKGERIDAWWLALDLQAERARATVENASSDTRNAMSALIVRSISAVARRLSTPPVYWIGDEEGGVTPIRDDWKAFTPVADGLEGRVVKGPGSMEGGKARVDVRRLDQPRMTFAGLEAGMPSVVEVRVHDVDERVGEQKATLPVVGSFALPVTDATKLRLFGAKAGVGAGSVASGGKGPRWFVPSEWASSVIGLALGALVHWIARG